MIFEVPSVLSIAARQHRKGLISYLSHTTEEVRMSRSGLRIAGEASKFTAFGAQALDLGDPRARAHVQNPSLGLLDSDSCRLLALRRRQNCIRFPVSGSVGRTVVGPAWPARPGLWSKLTFGIKHTRAYILRNPHAARRRNFLQLRMLILGKADVAFPTQALRRLYGRTAT